MAVAVPVTIGKFAKHLVTTVQDAQSNRVISHVRAHGKNVSKLTRKERSEALKISFGIDDAQLKNLRKSLSASIKNKKRTGTSGQYPGGPQGIDTPSKVLAQREAYLIHMAEGSRGRAWYEGAGEWTADVAGTDKRAELLERFLGRTSSGANVDVNTGFAIKGYNQNLAGQQIHTGRFPNEMRKDVQNWMETGQEFGPKTEPFTQKIGLQRNPELAVRPVHDIWDARAWGYVGKDGKPWDAGLGVAQHRYLDEEAESVMQVANEYGLMGFKDWNHPRAQASAWTGAKIDAGDINPEDAAKHFGDFAEKYAANATRETVPGTTTGHLGKLNESGQELKGLYNDEVNKIIYPGGKDRIAQGYGILSGDVDKGVGIWQDQINPATINPIYAGLDNPGKGLPRQVDPASRQLLNANESTYGLLTGQDAVAWNKPIYDAGIPKKTRNFIDIDFGEPMTPERAVVLQRAINSEFGEDAIGLATTPNGFGLIKFDDALGGADFEKRVQKALQVDGLPDYNGKFGYVDSGYIENPWNKPGGRYGQVYIDEINKLPVRPHGAAGFDEVASGPAKELAELDERFAKEYPQIGPVSQYLQQVRQAIAKGGMSALDQLVKTGKVPAIAAAVLVPYLSTKSQEAQAVNDPTLNRANDLERLLELYEQKGDKQGQLQVLREIDKMRQQVQAKPDSFLKNVMDVAGEGAAGFNNLMMEGADFLSLGQVNNVLQLAGSDKRVPTFKGGAEAIGATQGGFMEQRPNETLGEQFRNPANYVRAAGEAAALGLGLKQVPGRALTSSKEVAKELLGFGNAAAAQPLKQGGIMAGDVASAIDTPMSKRLERELAVKRGEGDIAGVGHKLSRRGKIVKARDEVKAVRLGLDKGLVGTISTMGKQTKARARKMLQVLERGRENMQYRYFNTPQKVVGELIDDRLKVIFKINRQSGRLVDDVAKKLKGSVDISGPKNQFIESLGEARIGIDEAGDLVFEGSAIEIVPKARRIIKQAWTILKNPSGVTSPQDAHFLKRQIDELVTYGKSESGLSGRMEGALKTLRRGIDTVLDTQYPKYNKVNTAYSDTIGLLNDLQALAGGRVDLTGPNVSTAVGSMGRKVLSNYNTQVPIMEVLDGMTDVARKYAPKNAALMDDWKQIATLEAEMRAMFPTAVKPNTIQGTIQTGASTAIDLARGDAPGLANRAANAVANRFSNQHERQIRALKLMLKD